jgi:hypothetical protein
MSVLILIMDLNIYSTNSSLLYTVCIRGNEVSGVEQCEIANTIFSSFLDYIALQPKLTNKLGVIQLVYCL